MLEPVCFENVLQCHHHVACVMWLPLNASQGRKCRKTVKGGVVKVEKEAGKVFPFLLSAGLPPEVLCIIQVMMWLIF